MVDGPCHQFFAHARLAFDEHRGLRSRDLLNAVHDVLQRITFANHVLKVVRRFDLIL
jgi:hypothetical protein